MKAAIYRRYGPPHVVQITDVPRPDLETTQALIKVRATTVTAADSRLRSANVPRGFGVMMRLGFGFFGPRKPILGWELTGEVVIDRPSRPCTVRRPQGDASRIDFRARFSETSRQRPGIAAAGGPAVYSVQVSPLNNTNRNYDPR